MVEVLLSRLVAEALTEVVVERNLGLDQERSTRLSKQLFEQPISERSLLSFPEELRKYVSELLKWVNESVYKNLNELASKIEGEAQKLGISVSEILGRIQRKVINFLIENAVVAEISVENHVFEPSEVNFEYSVEGSPILSTPNLHSIVKFLMNLPEFNVKVSVKLSMNQIKSSSKLKN